MGLLIDGDLPLLHRLEQRRLRARRGAIDLVDEDDVRCQRTGAIFERAASLVIDRDAGDVARHQVRRALDAAEDEVERSGDRARERGLPHPGYVVQEDVTLDEEGGEELLRRLTLPDDDPLDVLDQAVRRLADGQGHPETMRPRASAGWRGAAAGADRVRGRQRDRQAHESGEPVQREDDRVLLAQGERREGALQEQDERHHQQRPQRQPRAVDRANSDHEHHRSEEVHEPTGALSRHGPVATTRDESFIEAVSDEHDRHEQRDRSDQPRLPCGQRGRIRARGALAALAVLFARHG